MVEVVGGCRVNIGLKVVVSGLASNAGRDPPISGIPKTGVKFSRNSAE